MADYVLDSDILIDHLRGVRDYRSLLPSLDLADSVGCSTITVAEVLAGMKENEEDKTRALLQSLVHYPVDTVVAEKAAELRRSYRRQGQAIAMDDLFIAATVLLKRAVLVTGNPRHYPMVSSLVTPE